MVKVIAVFVLMVSGAAYAGDLLTVEKPWISPVSNSAGHMLLGTVTHDSAGSYQLDIPDKAQWVQVQAECHTHTNRHIELMSFAGFSENNTRLICTADGTSTNGTVHDLTSTMFPRIAQPTLYMTLDTSTTAIVRYYGPR